jgi:hypothetical protein
LPTHSRASRGSPGGLGGKAHPEPPLSSLAFGNASGTFHHHGARAAGLALYYQSRDCAALPSRPPGSPQGETLIPDPRPLTPATCIMVRLCDLADSSASGGLVRLWRACPPLAGPTGPAQVSRPYLYVVSLGRGVFQQPVNGELRVRQSRMGNSTRGSASRQDLSPIDATAPIKRLLVAAIGTAGKALVPHRPIQKPRHGGNL